MMTEKQADEGERRSGREISGLEGVESRVAERGLACQRAAFSLPAGLHYLNCAYLSPLPKVVEAAGVEALRRKRAPVTYPSESFFSETDRVRALFASLIGCSDPTRVAVVPSVSYGISTAARNVSADPGQNIVVSEEQFPSNVYAWRRLARERDLELRTVARPSEAPSPGQVWSRRIWETIDGDTAVVALPHVHWTDGTRFDLVSIGTRTREVGAALVVDASQSVGALPFDLEAVQPDALVCAGYKWLLASYGLGLAFFGPRFEGGVPLEETWIARQGSEDFQGLVRYTDTYQPGAVRYDVGGRSSFFLMPMLEKALELLLDWTPAAIQAYCRRLTKGFVGRVLDAGFALEEEEWRSAHILGLRLPGSVDLPGLSDRLVAHQVHVSLRGNAVRISPNVYNNSEDVETLEEVLFK